jgi:hypothetical protein
MNPQRHDLFAQRPITPQAPGHGLPSGFRLSGDQVIGAMQRRHLDRPLRFFFGAKGRHTASTTSWGRRTPTLA